MLAVLHEMLFFFAELVIYKIYGPVNTILKESNFCRMF